MFLARRFMRQFKNLKKNLVIVTRIVTVSFYVFLYYSGNQLIWDVIFPLFFMPILLENIGRRRSLPLNPK